MQVEADYEEAATTICYKNIPNLELTAVISLRQHLTWTSILKIEFCNLTERHIEILANILGEYDTIVEVSVNGNPNKAQNFYLLLCGTSIISLSLKYCSIDDAGVEKISNELYCPYDTSLHYLNLSSNWISNEGVKHIARFLRINRTLISLNLADNTIYDKGCLQLMMALQKFPLDFEETVLRRKMKFEIQRKNASFNSVLSIKNENALKPKKIVSIASLANGYPIYVNKTKLNPNTKLNAENHPFLCILNGENDSEDIFCPGNDVLINLNLSYNRITCRGLDGIIEMLIYQINHFAGDKGISRISTEGNDLNDCKDTLDKLKELVGHKTNKYLICNKNKNHFNSRKRS